MKEKSKIAIAVVYLVPKKYDFVLKLHLDCIREYTKDEDVTIYAFFNSLGDEHRNLINSQGNIKVYDIPPKVLEGAYYRESREHGYYLDHLVKAAVEDGADYVCTFDVDSFPIVPDWFKTIRAAMERETAPLCAVIRNECRDTVLPHPCCTVFTRDFYETYRPSFFPDLSALERPDYQDFFRATGQRVDTGIGYGLVLHQNDLPWVRLPRSNRIDDHTVMGAVYGDLIYHLGAFSRGKLFYIDKVEHMERHGIPLSDEPDDPSRLAVIARNDAAFRRICEGMAQDMTGYIRYLQGKEPHPLLAATDLTGAEECR